MGPYSIAIQSQAELPEFSGPTKGFTMQPDPQLQQLAAQLGQLLHRQRIKLTTAESCTGGWVAEMITTIPGSSQWFERGFVTYSNEAKVQMLGVKQDTLSKYGAVSQQTAFEMAEGALRHSLAQVSVAITGIAGPDGGGAAKPVGLVWFGFAKVGMATETLEQHFSGDRYAVRREAVRVALTRLLQWCR